MASTKYIGKFTGKEDKEIIHKSSEEPLPGPIEAPPGPIPHPTPPSKKPDKSEESK